MYTVYNNSLLSFARWRPILRVASVLGSREQDSKHTDPYRVSIPTAFRMQTRKK